MMLLVLSENKRLEKRRKKEFGPKKVNMKANIYIYSSIMYYSAPQ